MTSLNEQDGIDISTGARQYKRHKSTKLFLLGNELLGRELLGRELLGRELLGRELVGGEGSTTRYMNNPG